MSTIGERLREERERLGLSQPAFAALGGAGKHSQINYEADRRSPDGQYLSAVAAHGVDVLYVLTGQRTPGHELAQQVRRKHGAVLDMGEVGDHIERLTDAERAGGNARERDDMDLWLAAFETVNEAMAQSGRRKVPPEARARLILLAYDLLEEDAASSKERIIRLVKAT